MKAISATIVATILACVGIFAATAMGGDPLHPLHLTTTSTNHTTTTSTVPHHEPPPPGKPPCNGGPNNGGKDGHPGNDACDVTPPGTTTVPPTTTPTPPAVCPDGYTAAGASNGVLLCSRTITTTKTKVKIRTHVVVKRKIVVRYKKHIIFKRYCPKPPKPPTG